MRRETGRGRPGQPCLGQVAAVACLALLLTLAACDAGTSASTSGAPTATSTAATAAGGGQSATPLPVTPVNPGGAAVGPSGDVCQGSGAVAAPLPASIPAYPNGDLRIAQSGQGASLFGICTADTPAAVAQFYAGRLPAAGWGQIQTNAIASATLITAAKGDARLTLTIQPDPLVAGKTQIVIQAIGL